MFAFFRQIIELSGDNPLKSVELNSGDQMPVLGLGTWKMTPEVSSAAVTAAIEIGYRHIDCASIYGNEPEIGEAFAAALNSGSVEREELWVTSKLWNDCHRPEHVCGALEETLSDLQLDFLDLYLMHWPVAHEFDVRRPEGGVGFLSLDQVPLAETLMEMDECRRAGLCRNIGVANFSITKLENLIEDTSIVPTVNQVELHPLLQQNQLLEFCRERRIILTAYSPLGSPDRPDAMKRADEPSLLDIEPIVAIAREHSATPGQILLAWAIQRGTIPIPKSATLIHQQENLAAAEIALTESQMKSIAALDQHYRFVDGTFWEQPGGPYKVANLWNE